MKIIEMSSYIPESFLTSDELASRFKVNKEWIEKRTGIERIHISTISVADMAIKSIENLREEYEGIIFVSSKGSNYIPHYVKVAEKLGKNNLKFGIDVMNGFNGFVNALYLAKNILEEKAKRLLIVVAEKMSDFIDFNDINTSILFSDAAISMIVESEDEITCEYRFIQDTSYLKFLTVDPNGKLYMEGKQVYRFAVNNMVRIIRELLKDFNDFDDIVVVPHQANGRILESVSKELTEKENRNIKLLNHIKCFGNTGVSSIPLALYKEYKGKPFSLKNHILVSVSGGMSASGIGWKEVKNENKHSDHEVARYRLPNN